MAVETLGEFFSSMLDGATFDADTGVLTVLMKNGREYTAQISPDDWKDFQAAPSKGGWVRSNVFRP